MKQLNKRHHLYITLLAAFLITLIGCASSGTQRSTGEYIDDAAITAKVNAELLNDPKTKVLEIKVETYKGDVQLSGFVSSKEEEDRAVEVARGVKGVKSVKDNMLLRQP